jgi:hypothetical protein
MFLLILANRADAYKGNQRNILLGGRPALLGGAYTALSDDPYGIYYNPAGIVSGTKKTEISVSGNAFVSGTVVYKGAVAGRDFEESYASNFPTFIGGLYRFGPLGVGYAIMSIESRETNQNDRFENLQTTESTDAKEFFRAYQSNFEQLGYGTALSLRINKFSLGISTFYFNRSNKSMSHQYVEFNNDTVLTYEETLTTTNYGLMQILGMMYRDKTWSLGFTYEVKKSISNDTKMFVEQILLDTAEGGASPTISNSESEINFFDEMLPHKMTLGFAINAADFLLCSADIIYYTAYTGDVSQQPYIAHYDYSFGLEAHLSNLNFNLGVFSNSSSYSAIKTGDSARQPYINYVGTSFGIGFLTKGYEINVGAVSQASLKGSQAQILSNSKIQDVTAQSSMILYEMKTAL